MDAPLTSGAVPDVQRVPSLLAAPVADIEDVRPGDICMVGLFFDHADPNGFGARFAARQLRYASSGAGALSAGHRPLSSSRCVDLGDLNVFPLEPLKQREALMRQARAVFEAQGRLVVVGGAVDLGDVLRDAFESAGPDSTIEYRLLGDGVGAPSSRGTDFPIALRIDLSRLFAPSIAVPRPKKQLFDAIAALPGPRIEAVHLTGFAPQLDVSGRHDTAFAHRVLAAIVTRMQGVEDACP